MHFKKVLRLLCVTIIQLTSNIVTVSVSAALQLFNVNFVWNVGVTYSSRRFTAVAVLTVFRSEERKVK